MTDTDQREASLRRITTPNTRFDLDASEASQSADAAIAYDAGFVAGKRSQAAEIARLKKQVAEGDVEIENYSGLLSNNQYTIESMSTEIARLNGEVERLTAEHAQYPHHVIVSLRKELAEQAERYRAVLIAQAKLTAFYNGHSCTERDPYGVDGWKRYLCDEAKVFLASLDQASPAPGTLASLAQRAKDRGESDCLCLYAIEQTPGQPTVHDSRCKLASPRTAEGESDG